jgi:hypothetical protein
MLDRTSRAAFATSGFDPTRDILTAMLDGYTLT